MGHKVGLMWGTQQEKNFPRGGFKKCLDAVSISLEGASGTGQYIQPSPFIDREVDTACWESPSETKWLILLQSTKTKTNKYICICV